MAETISSGTATPREGPTTSPALIAVAWIVVVIPAGWGIFQTLKQSTQLFRRPIPAAVSAPAPTTTGSR